MPEVQIAIGLAGGLFLILMGIQSFRSLKTAAHVESKSIDSRPVLAGIILSAGNPYFLLWWATVGLALATQATKWGIWAFVLFALTHWLVDLIWLQVLSWASFKGTGLFGARSRRIVLLICAVALLFFGLFFIYNAAGTLIKTI
jgi:threonine/homoserine/homoserine lactone efflux protein